MKIEKIAERSARFGKNQRVTWNKGLAGGQVTDVLPTGLLVVEGKEGGQKVARIYDPDGVLCGRYLTNQDLTLDAAGDAPQDDDLMYLL
jgi:hypothetical protein